MSPYISTLRLTYLSMRSLFLVFYQEIALIFMLFSFLFAIPTFAYRQMGSQWTIFNVLSKQNWKSNTGFCISLDMVGEINFWSKLSLKASNLPFENFCLSKKRRLKVMGAFRKFRGGLSLIFMYICFTKQQKFYLSLTIIKQYSNHYSYI